MNSKKKLFKAYFFLTKIYLLIQSINSKLKKKIQTHSKIIKQIQISINLNNKKFRILFMQY